MLPPLERQGDKTPALPDHGCKELREARALAVKFARQMWAPTPSPIGFAGCLESDVFDKAIYRVCQRPKHLVAYVFLQLSALVQPVPELVQLGGRVEGAVDAIRPETSDKHFDKCQGGGDFSQFLGNVIQIRVFVGVGHVNGLRGVNCSWEDPVEQPGAGGSGRRDADYRAPQV